MINSNVNFCILMAVFLMSHKFFTVGDLNFYWRGLTNNFSRVANFSLLFPARGELIIGRSELKKKSSSLFDKSSFISVPPEFLVFWFLLREGYQKQNSFFFSLSLFFRVKLFDPVSLKKYARQHGSHTIKLYPTACTVKTYSWTAYLKWFLWW